MVNVPPDRSSGVARPEQEIPERAMEIENAQEFTLVKIWKRSIQI